MNKYMLTAWLILLLSLLCISCNDSNDKQGSLSGTTWAQLEEPPIEVNHYITPSIDQMLISLYVYFPSFTPSDVTIEHANYKEKDSTLLHHIREELLKFSGDQCLYTENIIDIWNVQQVDAEYKIVMFKEMECEDDKGRICKITSDGVYMIYKFADYTDPTLYVKLDNYKYKERINTVIVSEEEVADIENRSSISLQYKIFQEEIELSNDNFIWNGVFNKNNNIIELNQLMPEQKYMGQFILQ